MVWLVRPPLDLVFEFLPSVELENLNPLIVCEHHDELRPVERNCAQRRSSLFRGTSFPYLRLVHLVHKAKLS